MLLPAILIISGIILASQASKAISTSKAGDKLATDILELKYKGLSKGRVYFQLILEHTNPTGTDLNMEMMFLDILTGNKRLAKIVGEDLNFKILARAVTKQTLEGSATLTELATAVGLQIIQGKLPDKATVQGTIRVNGFTTEYLKEVPLQNPLKK